MPKEDPTKQLVISFDHDSLITDELAHGNFLTFSEVMFPVESERRQNAAKMIDELSRLYPSDMAFVIRLSQQNTLQELSALKQSTARPFLLALSGRHASVQQLRENAAQARSFGIRNFLIVTGDLALEDYPSSKQKSILPGDGYTDSVASLSILHDPQKGQSLACVFNPYMYTPEMVYTHYAKLSRKITAGAQIIIAQAGWDIKKAQELQWYLQMREQILPVVARIRLLSVDEAGALGNGPLEPGLTIPVPIAAKLMRLKDTPEQFQKYQEELAALLAIGYRKLGYAGILIAGASDAAAVIRIQNAANELDKSITSYNEWRSRWLDFHGDMSLDPPPTIHSDGTPFYLFENLLAPDLPLYSPAHSHITRVNFKKPNRWICFKAAMLAPNTKTILAKLAQPIFKPDPRFHNCYGLDNSLCPKRLSIGPCGNARPDGWCEANHAPCFFNTIAGIAAVRNELVLLEE